MFANSKENRRKANMVNINTAIVVNFLILEHANLNVIRMPLSIYTIEIYTNPLHIVRAYSSIQS